MKKNFLTHCLGVVPAWLCVSKEHFKQPSCESRKCPKNQSFSAKTLLVKATYSPAILRNARLSQYDFVWQLYSWFCESFAKQSCFSRKLQCFQLSRSTFSYLHVLHHFCKFKHLPFVFIPFHSQEQRTTLLQ